MLQVTGDGRRIAGLGMTARGAVTVRFDSTDEVRLLCGVLLEVAAMARTGPRPGDSCLRARGWDPEEFRRVGGAEQLQLHDLLAADSVAWSGYRMVSETGLRLISDRWIEAERGSFEELLVATAGLAMDADPDLGGLRGVMAIASPIAEYPVSTALYGETRLAMLALSPELPLPTVIETREIDIPGWLLCLVGDDRELRRLADTMAERRLWAGSFL